MREAPRSRAHAWVRDAGMRRGGGIVKTPRKGVGDTPKQGAPARLGRPSSLRQII